MFVGVRGKYTIYDIPTCNVVKIDAGDELVRRLTSVGNGIAAEIVRLIPPELKSWVRELR